MELEGSFGAVGEKGHTRCGCRRHPRLDQNQEMGIIRQVRQLVELGVGVRSCFLIEDRAHTACVR